MMCGLGGSGLGQWQWLSSRSTVNTDAMYQHLCCKILKGTVHYIVSKFLSKNDVYNYARSTICCTQLSDSHMIYTFNIIGCDMVMLNKKAHLVEITGSAETLRKKGDILTASSGRGSISSPSSVTSS